MQRHPTSLLEMIFSLVRNWSLVVALTKREVMGRYRGSAMGILWSLLHPIFLLFVYTLVFSVVFRARWSQGGESRTEFALILFSGLILFNVFSESVNRAPGIVINNVNYVKKVVFPLEILGWVTVASALFHAVISLAVWLAAFIIFRGLPSPTALFLPVVALPLVLFSLGMTWLLASFGVYLRDVSQVTGILTTALLFLSPIFYPLSALPEPYRTAMLFNPVTTVLEQARETLFAGRIPDLGTLGMYWLVSLLVAWAGFAWFQKTRKGFSDVL